MIPPLTRFELTEVLDDFWRASDYRKAHMNQFSCENLERQILIVAKLGRKVIDIVTLRQFRSIPALWSIHEYGITE